MVATLDILKSQYEANYSLYSKFISEMESQLKALLDEAQIKTGFPIESRVKAWTSFQEKIERNNLQIDHISEVRDLAGIRIVLLFKRDVPVVCELISQNFEVIRLEDTSSRLSENQFGYGSIHFEVTPKKTWREVPTLRAFDGLVVEIQVRTAPQHIWAAASHVLQYKKENHVPIPLRRTISRVSALLETVDMEFDRILQEREDYITKPSESSDQLNIEKLRNIMDRFLPEKNKRNDRENYSLVLDELFALGVRTVGEVEDIISRRIEEAIKEDNNNVQEIIRLYEEGNKTAPAELVKKHGFYTHTGLMRYMMRLEFGDQFMQ